MLKENKWLLPQIHAGQDQRKKVLKSRVGDHQKMNPVGKKNFKPSHSNGFQAQMSGKK